MASSLVTVACSNLNAAGSSSRSRTISVRYSPAPRNEGGRRSVLASGPLRTARNQRSPERRANAASSPISEGGSTIVSSQTLGMLLIISAAGFVSRPCGWAA